MLDHLLNNPLKLAAFSMPDPPMGGDGDDDDEEDTEPTGNG